MGEMANFRNVFDDQDEFNKLNDLILGAIQDFSTYRQGNLTYGEIMFVMECILDSLRGNSEKDAKSGQALKGVGGTAPTFSTLLSVTARLVERLVKKGVITGEDETFILHGEE